MSREKETSSATADINDQLTHHQIHWRKKSLAQNPLSLDFPKNHHTNHRELVDQTAPELQHDGQRPSSAAEDI